MGHHGLGPVLGPPPGEGEHAQVEDRLGGLLRPATPGALQADLAARTMKRLHGAGANLEAASSQLAIVQPMEVALHVRDQRIQAFLAASDRFAEGQKHILEQPFLGSNETGHSSFVSLRVRALAVLRPRSSSSHPDRLPRGCHDTLHPGLPLLPRKQLAGRVRDLLDDMVWIQHQDRRRDFWHLTQKLGDAAKAAGEEVKHDVQRYKGMLRRNDEAIEAIEAEVKTWAEPYLDKEEELPEGLTTPSPTWRQSGAVALRHASRGKSADREWSCRGHLQDHRDRQVQALRSTMAPRRGSSCAQSPRPRHVVALGARIGASVDSVRDANHGVGRLIRRRATPPAEMMVAAFDQAPYFSIGPNLSRLGPPRRSIQWGCLH